eukprot:COSAG06_NODE_67_length_26084_cov_784.027670_20_plen_137_part_00
MPLCSANNAQHADNFSPLRVGNPVRFPFGIECLSRACLGKTTTVFSPLIGKLPLRVRGQDLKKYPNYKRARPLTVTLEAGAAQISGRFVQKLDSIFTLNCFEFKCAETAGSGRFFDSCLSRVCLGKACLDYAAEKE